MTRFDLVLFGDPVEHSLSPVLQQAALQGSGLTGVYRAIRVGVDGFRQGCRDLRAGAISGANVTMPHKRLAAAEVDERSEGAKRSDSVNTIVVEDSRLVGHSTDIDGIVKVWEEAGLPSDAPVLVLGAGGAAAAALIALGRHQVLVASRRRESAERLAAAVDVPVQTIPWTQTIPGAVVVNATPLGMAGESLPFGVVEESAGLLDMPYQSGPTPAVETANRLGIPCASGTDLLVAQAASSFMLWTGRSAPLAAMRRALQNAQATE